MTILKSVAKTKQKKMPPELVTPVMKMEDSPTFYFNTYTFFKRMFFTGNKAFDRSVSYCYSSNPQRPAQDQSKWIILLSLLKGQSAE